MVNYENGNETYKDGRSGKVDKKVNFFIDRS